MDPRINLITGWWAEMETAIVSLNGQVAQLTTQLSNERTARGILENSVHQLNETITRLDSENRQLRERNSVLDRTMYYLRGALNRTSDDQPAIDPPVDVTHVASSAPTMDQIVPVTCPLPVQEVSNTIGNGEGGVLANSLALLGATGETSVADNNEDAAGQAGRSPEPRRSQRLINRRQ